MTIDNKFNAIKEFFDSIDKENVSLVKNAVCIVRYKTDNSNYDRNEMFPISVSIANNFHYYVVIYDLDEKKYHIQFDSNYQVFHFDGKALTIRGQANGKQFNHYMVTIFVP